MSLHSHDADLRADRAADAGFPWRRAFVFGLLWALARTASEALALPSTQADWHIFVDVSTSMLLVWTPVGLVIVYAAFSAERRFTRARSIALALFPLAVLLPVLINVAWWGFEQLGYQPPATAPIGTALVGVDSYVYGLWMVLAYGGPLAALCVFLIRLERERELLVQTEVERRQAQAQLEEAEFDGLLQRVDPALVRRALAAVQRRQATEPAAADELLDLLVGFLRGAMPGVRRAQSTLADEIELVRAYARLRQALDPTPHGWRIDAAPREPEIVFPPLVLIPILDRLEASPTLDGGWFELRVLCHPGGMLLTMDGPGRHVDDWLPEETLLRLRTALHAASGEAWRLVVAEPGSIDRPAVALCLGEWPAVETNRPDVRRMPLAAWSPA